VGKYSEKEKNGLVSKEEVLKKYLDAQYQMFSAIRDFYN